MYEALLNEAQRKCIEVVDLPFRGRIKGLYFNNVIAINSRTKTAVERACILAEELGHHYTSAGDILDQTHLLNRKQEHRARRWGYERLVPLDKLVVAHKFGIQSPYELADILGVTEPFLVAALQHYISKHGPYCRVGNYWVHFKPFRIFECFSNK